MSELTAAPAESATRYPPAHRLDLVESMPVRRGTVTTEVDIADPYRWLEDPDSPETAAWSAAQDELLAAERSTWTARPQLRQRIETLVGTGMVGPPVWRGQRQFGMRRDRGQEHAVLWTTDPGAASARVLLDPMTLDPTGATTLDTWQPSKEGDLLAYQISEGGREESVLWVIDVMTGAVVDGPIDRARYSPIAWVPGGQSYYYVRRIDPTLVPEDQAQYHRRIYLHQVGTDPATDIEVFGDGRDFTEYYGVSVSMDGRWLSVSASPGTAPRNDLWLADLTTSPATAPALTVIQQGVDAQTGLHVGRDGRAYIFTDADAPRGRLTVTHPTTPTADTWRDLLPQDDEAVLEDFAILDGPELSEPLLVAAWTRHAISELTVHDLVTGERRGVIALPGVGSVGGLSARPEGGHDLWVTYTDSVTPSNVLHFDARTFVGTTTDPGQAVTALWAQAPGAVELPAVQAQQVVYQSADGTDIRLLVISSSATPSQPGPTLLYGYGGFGASMTPGYSASILAWVEAGGTYAIANLRGGGEEGEQWHRDGMLGKKQNVFDDFHAAAQYLITQGWTTPAQLAISGGSNGGLLVGAALTQRPELFAAVTCSAPLLDMVRFEKFGLGQTWAQEYGSAADPEQLGWLVDYSPYHRVAAGTAYPATLFTVFDGDTRVDPLHARKLAAALQAATSESPKVAPIVLRREANVGHGGRAVSKGIDLSADSLAFAAQHTGLANAMAVQSTTVQSTHAETQP
jgi:prolyl oligopeptidase